MLLVNTFDVEPWWASSPGCIHVSEWVNMTDRSERPIYKHLDLCDEMQVKCTFFFLGWYAMKLPEIVREVVRRGHEIGCHSLTHEDMTGLTTSEFRMNTIEAKTIIEDAASSRVTAYRAPCFSFPPGRTHELLLELANLGFTIDSSITTAERIHGGGHRRDKFPGPGNLLTTMGIDIFEVPVPGVKILNREFTAFGGGYLRMIPRPMLNIMTRNEDYQVLYLHPHDYDRHLPPLPKGGIVAQMRRRLQVGDLRSKLKDLYSKSVVMTCGQLRDKYQQNGLYADLSNKKIPSIPNHP